MSKALDIANDWDKDLFASMAGKKAVLYDISYNTKTWQPKWKALRINFEGGRKLIIRIRTRMKHGVMALKQ